MLEDSLVESGRHARTRKPWTVAVSTTIHTLLVGGLLILPLLHTQALPLVDAMFLLRPPEASVPQAAQPMDTAPPLVQKAVIPAQGDLIAPSRIPSEIVALSDMPDANVNPSLSGRAPSFGSVLGIIDSGQTALREPAPLPPPPLVVPEPVIRTPVRVSGGVQAANLIYRPKPAYPPLALKTRVQGVVVLEAKITREGTIDSLRVISGHPLLIDAAIDAVKQWRYRPMLLNGEPIEVITTITVNFTFSQ